MNTRALLLFAPFSCALACVPVASVDGGEVFGTPFVPAAAVVQPSDDDERSLVVILSTDATLCDQLQAGTATAEDATALLSFQISDEDPLAVGDYSVDGQAIGGAWIQRDSCDEEAFFALAVSGSISLTEFTPGGDAAATFDTTFAEADFGGGIPNTDSVDGTFTASLCEFDADDLTDPCDP